MLNPIHRYKETRNFVKGIVTTHPQSAVKPQPKLPKKY
jgi:hypothetical protein